MQSSGSLLFKGQHGIPLVLELKECYTIFLVIKFCDIFLIKSFDIKVVVASSILMVLQL